MTLRVLLVEDDPAVAAVQRAYVEAVPGFAVAGTAATGAEALAAVGALAPDLVLLDVHLPDVSGLEVLRVLRSRPGPAVDVIAVTAAREVESVRAAMAGGVLQYLVKPFSLEAFRERLQAYAATREELERRRDAALAQDDVDRLLGRAPAAGAAREPAAAAQVSLPGPPKGLSPRSLALVAAQLRDAPGDLSASEVADRCGMSRVSARRYLEHLEAAGLAQVRPRYGTAGRPEHGYRWRAGRSGGG